MNIVERGMVSSCPSGAAQPSPQSSLGDFCSVAFADARPGLAMGISGCLLDQLPRHCNTWRMDTSRPNTLPWPPILYGLALLVPWLAQTLIPLPLIAAGRIGDDLLVAVGWALVALGLTVNYLALRSFAGADTPVSPIAPAERLVTFGLYNRTRNPMYLAMLVAFMGLALATGNLWRFAAVPALWAALVPLAVAREEAHLAARFADEWPAYAARVKRWW
jgi:protein-S-isoprenylcysteine O-methyltransferase Ste14